MSEGVLGLGTVSLSLEPVLGHQQTTVSSIYLQHVFGHERRREPSKNRGPVLALDDEIRIPS